MAALEQRAPRSNQSVGCQQARGGTAPARRSQHGKCCAYMIFNRWQVNIHLMVATKGIVMVFRDGTPKILFNH
jgi:hypothetical protein